MTHITFKAQQNPDPGKTATACVIAPVFIGKKLADSVHVCLLPNLHASAAMPFLEAGINVLLEKPMCETSEQCRALSRAADKGGAKLCVNHNFAFEPAFLRCKEILAGGELGKIHHILSHWNTPLNQIQLNAERDSVIEAFALLAIAAHETGNTDDYRWALAAAIERGVDAAPLEQLAGR